MLSPEEIDTLFPEIWGEPEPILSPVDLEEFTAQYPDYEQNPIFDRMKEDGGRMGEVARELEEEFNVPDFDL